MDTELSDVSAQENYGTYLNPFGGASDRDVTRDGLCQNGAEIFLKRIFNKLFKQVNELQPDELDDEFIYHSTITYKDYLEMTKNINQEQINCASLINMENILSKIMSKAVVRRPMHTSMFGNLLFQSTPLSLSNSGGLLSTISPTSLHIHLLMVLLIVGFIAWFFNSKVGVKMWKTLPLSIMLVGFIEFCMHKNDLKMKHRLNSERCRNPSVFARFASLVNYDYDNCNSDTANVAASIPNIAFTGVEYLSELIFQPMVHLGEKFGTALQSYLNSFTGFNYILAPIFPIIALIAFFIVSLPLIVFAFSKSKCSSASPPKSNQKPAKSPKKLKTNSNNNRTNAIK